ncbi:MAG: IPT/TIG domain-containing protein [Candidatus Sericytochromatia bacterium]|nr:IPT/TIG domain-containing protein [Candidatus Tanganyikabacteria bacterium]
MPNLAGAPQVPPGEALGHAPANATPAPTPSVAPPAPGSAEARRGPLFGVVLKEPGVPAAGVPVTAFLANANPLAGNSGGGLVGNAGSGLAGNSGGGYRILALETTTDASGAFVLSPDLAGAYNLEAAADPGAKAWRAEVLYTGSGTKTDVGELTLAPTGKLSGQVLPPDPSVKDLSNTQVFIPGSGYGAVTGEDGQFTLPNVPAGKFRLRAYHPDLGEAIASEAVAVTANETKAAAPLRLAVSVPKLDTITLAAASQSTDNGAPGAEVDLHGSNFGKTKGTRFTVDFNGAPVEEPNRISDGLLRVKIPPGAANGNVTVRVGGIGSNQRPFRVIKTLDLRISSLRLPPGASYDLGAAVVAKDTDGARMQEVVEDGQTKVPGPNVRWETSSAAGQINARGVLQAVSEGEVVVVLRGGEKFTRTTTVTIQAGVRLPEPYVEPVEGPTPPPRPAPRITGVDPGSGGSGRMVTLRGENFGDGGEPAKLLCGDAALPIDPSVLDAGKAQFAVPLGMGNCNLALQIGDRKSNGVVFRTLRALVIDPADQLDVPLGATASFEVTGIDAEGTAVVAPVVDWTSASPEVVAVDARTGVLTGAKLGSAKLLASSGSVLAVSRALVFQIAGIELDLKTLRLNAMPEAGNAEAGFVTAGVVTATVLTSDSKVRDVAWSVPAGNGRVALLVDPRNPNVVTVRTLRGATAGTVLLTARAKDDPGKAATASIEVTTASALEVDVR